MAVSGLWQEEATKLRDVSIFSRLVILGRPTQGPRERPTNTMPCIVEKTFDLVRSVYRIND